MLTVWICQELFCVSSLFPCSLFGENVEQKTRSAAHIQKGFVGNLSDLLRNIAAADLSVPLIVIGIPLVIFGGLLVKMLFG